VQEIPGRMQSLFPVHFSPKQTAALCDIMQTVCFSCYYYIIYHFVFLPHDMGESNEHKLSYQKLVCWNCLSWNML